MEVSPRLRQVALVARRLAPLATRLRNELRLGEPYRDAGVAEFGLENAVFAAGESFVEVVAPIRAGTTAGRYLDRRGGDAGYMAIFQVGDIHEARCRVAGAGVRTVWTADLPDMAGTHLHPKDVPGAIVSLDWADPPESWRWAGPAWTGRAPEHPSGGIRSLTVRTDEPRTASLRWASVLGVEAEVAGHSRAGDDAATGEHWLVRLDEGRQCLRFVAGAGEDSEGIAEVTLALGGSRPPAPQSVDIGGVRFVVVPAPEGRR